MNRREDSAARGRAAARNDWPVRKLRLTEESAIDLLADIETLKRREKN